MARLIGRYVLVALLVAGSAILLFSCDKPPAAASGGDEALMTEYSEHLSVIMSENGRRSYFFKAPLLEGYTLVKEPYREFRKGIEITTYQDDSLTTVDAVLTANYAIYYENRKLWEAKGDVVVVKSDGKTLYTQQLFWKPRRSASIRTSIRRSSRTKAATSFRARASSRTKPSRSGVSAASRGKWMSM